MTRDVWHDALRPDVSGVAVDALLFHEAGSRLVHRYRVYKDPFPHPALRNGVIPRLLSCVGRAMAITRLTHLRILIPSSGAPVEQVPMECFPQATAPVSQARRRHVSFAEEVTTLNAEEVTMLNADESPEFPPVSPPLILPVVMEEAAVVSATGATPLIMPEVEEIENDSPAAELVEIQTTTPKSGVLPPPGLPCTVVYPDCLSFLNYQPGLAAQNWLPFERMAVKTSPILLAPVIHASGRTNSHSDSCRRGI